MVACPDDNVSLRCERSPGGSCAAHPPSAKMGHPRRTTRIDRITGGPAWDKPGAEGTGNTGWWPDPMTTSRYDASVLPGVLVLRTHLLRRWATRAGRRGLTG